MINANRIVPVEKIDLISLYGLVLKQDTTNNSALAKIVADDVAGDYTIKTNNAVLIADQPVSTCDIDATASSVSACTLYFVPAYTYAGFTIDGVAVTPTGTVEADGATLYKAVLSSSAITITKVGF